jgi:glycolate oxidase iron-sulfur subunit
MSRKSPADIAAGCIRCGFCLDACPTFKLTANEAESPRGRIYLMRHVLDAGRPWTPPP